MGRSTAIRAAAGALLAAGLAATAAAEEIFYDGFKYPAGKALAAKGKYEPDYEVAVDDEQKEGRSAVAVVAPRGLAIRGKKSFGLAALIGTATEEHSARGSVAARRKAEYAQAKSETLYLSLFISIAQESDLPDPGARVGVRLLLEFAAEGESQASAVELGIENHEQTGRVFAAFGAARLQVGEKVKAGQTYHLVLRLRDPKGPWNTEVAAAIDPGKEEPQEWTLVRKGGTKGDYRLTGVELFAERAGWTGGPTRAVGLVDEVRIGSTYEDVVAAR